MLIVQICLMYLFRYLEFLAFRISGTSAMTQVTCTMHFGAGGSQDFLLFDLR